MSDTSSSILFVPVPKATPSYVRPPTTPSQSAVESESITYLYNGMPHVIQPGLQTGPMKGARFEVHSRPHNPFKPAMIRTPQENIRALEALYDRGQERNKQREDWALAEQEKNDAKQRLSEGCTFSPEISSYAKSLRRPRAMSPENRFKKEVDTKLQYLASQRAQSESKELKECTFRPLTLSAARVEPSSYVRRLDRHTLLFEDAAVRERTRARIASLMEEKAVKSGIAAGRAMVLDEEEELVERLSKPIAMPERPSVKFEPVLNAESERLVHAIRSRDPSPQSVVERLFRPADMKVPFSNNGNVVSHQPQLNRHSQEIVARRQLSYLTELFSTLGADKPMCRVTDVARSAMSRLPLERAEELVTILRTVESETLTHRQFIELCTSPTLSKYSVVHPPTRDPEAIAERKRANTKNNNKFEEYTYAPQIDSNSKRLVKQRSERPPVVVEASNAPMPAAGTHVEQFTFSPSINPLPAYLQTRKAELIRKMAIQTAKDTSPAPIQSRAERLRELNQRATQVGNSYLTERIASDALIAELHEAIAEARHRQAGSEETVLAAPSESQSSHTNRYNLGDDNLLELLRRRRLLEDN